MKNLKEIIQRYAVKKAPLHSSVTSFLGWQDRQYYEINSDKPLMFTYTGEGLKLDINGIPEVYEIVNGKPKYLKSKTLDHYYPHPYFPLKDIKSFEVIRIMPYASIGDVFKVRGECIDLQHGLLGNIYMINDCLSYPEFFKPKY